MTITKNVRSQYFAEQSKGVIRLAPTLVQQARRPTKRNGKPWTLDEHDRFLQAMELYPTGPWKVIAAHVGTRTTRQTMTHAQKYREKIARRKRTIEEMHMAVARTKSMPEMTTTSELTTTTATSTASSTISDSDMVDWLEHLTWLDVDDNCSSSASPINGDIDVLVDGVEPLSLIQEGIDTPISTISTEEPMMLKGWSAVSTSIKKEKY